MRSYGFFKGVDIDEGSGETPQDKFERAERRAAARLAGKSEEEIEREGEVSFEDLGIEVE